MIRQYLEKVMNTESLTFDEAYNSMSLLMEGAVNASQMSAMLTALRMKGETAEEIAGFASAMRDNSVKINSNGETVIDVCGTGGDSSNTFNISTAAGFVAAGAGIKVAKHGNRSISSSSGSADVLAELGINIALPPEVAEKALAETGITFLFAPYYHPAMKNIAPVRKELAVKTVFNILGPLTNPAGTKNQLIGAYNYSVARKMSEAAAYLKMDKVCFICTADKYDEVTLTEDARVFEYNTEMLCQYSFDNEKIGYPKLSLGSIQGFSPKQNAGIINDLFTKKEKTPAYYVVAANAAFGLYAAGYSTDLKECASAAEESIDSGKALDVLNAFREFGEKYS